MDVADYKIQEHLGCFQFLKRNVYDPGLEDFIKDSDVVLFLASICNPSLYIIDPVGTIRSNFTNPSKVADLCAKHKKWFITTSTCEVYGRTISSYVSDTYDDPDLYVQNVDTTPLVLGPIKTQRWSYACAKQLLDRYVYALGDKEGLSFTIIRPYNFFGPRMDYIPEKDGIGVPRIVACFMKALLDKEPIQLVDGGKSYRTITYIGDAIDAYVKILENKENATGQIFNIANPDNEATVYQLAELFRSIYAKVTGNSSYFEHPIVSVPSKKFYGKGYEDCDRRVPDITNVRERIGWEPQTNLEDTLTLTLKFFKDFYKS